MGWEIPAGIADPAEDLVAAAAREACKESGWEPQGLEPLIRLEAASGLSDSVNHVYWTRRAIHRGDPPAAFEAERIDWIPLDQVAALIAGGQITDLMGLARHGAHTFWGLLTRTAATIAAHTLMRLYLTKA